MTSCCCNSFDHAWRAMAQAISNLIVGPASTATQTKEKFSIKKTSTSSKKRSHEENDVSITVSERVDVAALQLVLANIEWLVPEERTKFRNYATTLLTNNGGQTVVYYIPSHGFGRLYPEAVCLQGFSRRLRSTLSHNLFWDIDANNSHPVVLEAIAMENGWQTPCLSHYIKNRELVLESSQLPRNLAKKLMLLLMYGGNPVNFLREEVAAGTLVGSVEEWQSRIPQFIYKYGAELRHLAGLVQEAYPEVCDVIKAKKKTNVAASAMSLLVQTRETEAIMAAVEFIQFRGWELGVLMHDGFMVYKREDEGMKITPGLLNGIKMKVLEKCGVRIDFELKEFEAPFTK